MTLNRLWAAPVVAIFILGGCDAGDEPPEEPGAEAPDTVEELATTPGELASINRSGVRGSARLEPEGGERLLRVQVEGMEPDERYTAHVHDGRCAEGGPIRLPLGRLTAGEDGTASTQMRLAADRLPADADLFVQVHAADDQPVACADLERANGGS